MGPAFRARRDQFIHDGLPAKQISKTELIGEPRELQISYFEPSVDDLELEGQPDILLPQEQAEMEAALLHPSIRSAVQQQLAEVALVTSQKSARKKKPATTTSSKMSRVEKGVLWRQLRYSTVSDRLGKLMPTTGKKEDNKKMKKADQKAVAGKPSWKMYASRKVAKLHLEKLQAASKNAKARKGESGVDSALNGKAVRMCAPEASLFWRNAQGTVHKVRGDTAAVLMKGTSSLCSDIQSASYTFSAAKRSRLC